MGKLASHLFFFFFLLLSSLILPTTSQEVEDEREFNYEEDGKIGPAHWGKLHPEWFLCGNGTMQSPIDLQNKRVEIVSHLGRLNTSYEPSNSTLQNRGHDMMLKWEGGAGSIHINGTDYVLEQIHWHSPSEHTIDGKRFALEAHLVHYSLDKKVAVVGILYTIGKPDPFLTSLEDYLEEVAGTNEEKKVVGIVDPGDIQMDSRKYYRYFGSLTVPPCDEHVLWTIVTKMMTVTSKQVNLLRVAVHDESNTNARPLQKLNGRPVQLYIPDKQQPED